MKIVQLSLAIAIALSLGAAFAQTNKPAPAASAVTARDCEKPRHDHRAEKGNPVPASSRCANEAAHAASKPMHDHGKVHKQQ